MAKIGGQSVPHKTILLIATECALMVLGLVAATYLRFLSFDGSPLEYLNRTETILKFALVVFVCEMSFYYNDVYDLQIVKGRFELLVHLLQALGIASLFLAIIYYFDFRLSLGRGIAVLAAPTILLLIFVWRWFLNTTGISLRRADRMLVMGTGNAGIELVRELIARPEFNCKVVGFLDESGENIGKSLVNPGIIGATANVEEIARDQRVNRVVLSLKERRGQTPVRELLHLRFQGVTVEEPQSVYERLTGRILLEHLSPSYLIFSEGFRKSRFLLAAKRAIDIGVSGIGLAICWPVMLLVALAIYLEDGAPVLFRQERIGLHGRRFNMLKFRSMRLAKPDAPPSWTAEGDRRITRVGQFIRKSRLDELPQFINVLRGDMSLVGPRPEQPYFCELLEQQIPFFAFRHTVRPGITGWAQIKYQYGASVEDAKRKLELDLFYIKHLSVFVDLVIIAETVKVMLIGRGAK